MGYSVPGEGKIENMYCTDEWLFEQYAGDRLWSWGFNSFGQIGDNTTTRKSSPVQTVAGGTNWKQVAVGGYTISEGFIAVIKTDGTLWSCGRNGSGQLGDNTNVNKSSPVQTISAGTIWKQVACGQYHTSAIKIDGSLWLWGLNSSGQLGDSTSTVKSSPVQTASAGTNWKQVSAGYTHTAAIKTDGTLWSWGLGTSGQLGDNSLTTKSSPVQTVAGGTTWKQVSCGQFHTAAIKTDGSLWAWGVNGSGQLGDNTNVNKSSPVQTISAGTTWKQVSCGFGHTAAIKTDGTLWLWGLGTNGQLGDNTLATKSSPVQTVSAGTNWKQVACGYYHSAAIKTDGSLWAWGVDSYGQLGDNSVTTKSSPVQTVAGGNNWKQVSCGFHATSAITINNTNTIGAF